MILKWIASAGSTRWSSSTRHFAAMAACSKPKVSPFEPNGDRRGQAGDMCSETCGLPERFEVTNENARAIRDMFREKNGGSLTFKLDDTKVRLKVNLRGSLEFFEVKRKRAAATPAPSSPKRRRVLPVDALPQMQEALSDVLQKGALPGVASLDGKGASLTSAAAVSQD